MTRSIGRKLALALVLATGLLGVSSGVVGRGTPPDISAASAWRGGIDLYRSGVFTTQASWLWCTAADLQMIRNIVRDERNHTTAAQRRFFSYMRAHNRYDIPVSDGVDPAGWTAGLRHYVDSRYRLVASRSFDAALRSAVTNLRKTGLPVGITVAHGNHAWILTGFTATADPAVTTRFTITSVRVTGPLWGLQSRSYGYDMRPDTKLTPKQLRGFFTPWHYARVRMAWEGRWVSIQPIPKAAPPAATAPPAPTASAPPSGPRSITPSASPSPSPSTTPTESAAAASASSADTSLEPSASAAPAAPVPTDSPGGPPAAAAVLLIALAGSGLLVARRVTVRR